MLNYQRLKLSRIAGRVMRAHTVPLIHRQTVGEHTYNVAHILMLLLDTQRDLPALQLLIAALYHDIAEGVLGDTPANTKWKYPYLEESLKRAEDSVHDEYAIPRLDPSLQIAKMLKFADCLELALFCIEEMKMGNTLVTTMGRNVLKAIETKGLVDVTPAAYEVYGTAMMEFESLQEEGSIHEYNKSS